MVPLLVVVNDDDDDDSEESSDRISSITFAFFGPEKLNST